MKSPENTLRFGEFTLDAANRRLSRAGTPIELGGRYLDALVMLASAPGQLISKDRLHDEVWRGVPVTDEALSQAIMALRKALGDDAARPRFIETVPRHGYRFVGAIEDSALPASPERPVDATLALVSGGSLGAMVAGLLVGLAYGVGATGTGTGNGAGSAVSLVMVLVCVSVLAAMVSGLGIAGGIALALRRGEDWWKPVAGGALGGLVVGGFARLLGIDTLRLLMGSAPERMAGAGEGLLIGAIAGAGVWLLSRGRTPARFGSVVLGGALAGAALIALGGTLMAGSLTALVTRFPGAGLSMNWAQGTLPVILSGAFEGAVFSAMLCAGMTARKGGRTAP